jgi:GNAT superfamily N-acetyltransferase
VSRDQLVRDDFGAFFEVPFRQYGAEVEYVSPFRGDLARFLDARANPTFPDRDDLTTFALVRGGAPVGRITAHVQRGYNDKFGTRTGFFGFFDVPRDPDVARQLLDAAGEQLRSRGCREMLGPFNLMASQEMGTVTSGHEKAPFLAQASNPTWTGELLEANGLTPVFPMTTWRLDLTRQDGAGLLGPRQAELMGDPDLTIRPVSRRGFGRWLAVTRELLNDSFAQNPHFVPLSPAEFQFQAGALLWIFDPRISFIAQYKGEPVGVIACVPDINPLLRATRSRLLPSTPWHYARYRMSRTRATLVFGGVRPEMQSRGLAGLLTHRAVTALRGAGYRELGITWISDANAPSLRQMEKAGAEPLHRLSMFRRPL